MGEQGRAGDVGPSGPKGTRGIKGMKGHRGDMGERGRTGEMGEKGNLGIRGPTGIEGRKGEPGPFGMVGPKGNDGPSGVAGDLGLTGPKGSEGVGGNKGETGPMGPPGPPGPPAEAPLLPPELLFQNQFTKGEERMKRDLEMINELADLDDGDIDELMGLEAPGKPKKTKKRRKDKDNLGPKFLDMYSSIYTMRQEMERIRKPTGTRENPVRTCRDLYLGHPKFPDGWYWIDPNLGMPDDAIYVYCNLTSHGETCISPDIHSSQMQNIPWRKDGESTDWYSNLRGGFRVRG